MHLLLVSLLVGVGVAEPLFFGGGNENTGPKCFYGTEYVTETEYDTAYTEQCSTQYEGGNTCIVEISYFHMLFTVHSLSTAVERSNAKHFL